MRTSFISWVASLTTSPRLRCSRGLSALTPRQRSNKLPPPPSNGLRTDLKELGSHGLGLVGHRASRVKQP